MGNELAPFLNFDIEYVCKKHGAKKVLERGQVGTSLQNKIFSRKVMTKILAHKINYLIVYEFQKSCSKFILCNH